MNTPKTLLIFSFFFGIASSLAASTFERTGVLPKGIRSVTVKQMNTTIREKFDNKGNKGPLAKDLNKSLKIKDIVKKETGRNKALLKSYLDLNDFKLESSLGEFKGDMAARVRVTVPILSYGLTDNLTVALVFPIYEAYSSVSLDFETNDEADRLVASLASHNSNRVGKALETRSKLNNARGGLNSKLEENGYQTLNDWSGRGFGDIMAVLKYRFLNASLFKSAATLGVSFPTGRVSNPDILNDIPFGAGAMTLFSSLIVDQNITSWLFINQFVKGTIHFPHISSVRMKTPDEALAVPKRSVDFLMGNKIETGVSTQVNTSFGLTGGFGYVFERKLQDHYDIPGRPVEVDFLQKDTDSFTNSIVAKLGYSSLEAFKRKQVPVPMMASLEYKKQLWSKNAPMKDFINFEISIFF